MSQFNSDPRLDAFFALQAYVKEGIQKSQVSPISIHALLAVEGGQVKLSFVTHRVRVNVFFHRTPKPLHGLWPPSRFEVVQSLSEDPNVEFEPRSFEFIHDFLASGVAQAGDEVIKCLML